MSDTMTDVNPRSKLSLADRIHSENAWPELILGLTGHKMPDNPSVHIACPLHGGENDFRFVNDNGKGEWVCTCSDGKFLDGFEFLKRHLKEDFKSVLHLSAEYLGINNNNGLARKRVQIPVKKPQSALQKDNEDSKKRAIELTNYILDKCTKSKTHPYLKAKGLSDTGLSFLVSEPPHNQLVIPLYDLSNPDNLIGAQLISPESNDDGKYPKINTKGTPVKNAIHIIKGSESEYIAIVEGFTTGLSVFLATGYTTVITLGKDGMVAKAERIQALYPNAELVFFADNDESGKGIESALRASQLVMGKVAMSPELGDWNDFHSKYGLELTKDAINSGLSKDIKVFNKSHRHGYIDQFTPIQVITKDGIVTVPFIEAIRSYQGNRCYCPITSNEINIQNSCIQNLKDGFVLRPTIGRLHNELVYDEFKELKRNKNRLARIRNEEHLVAYFNLNSHKMGSVFINAKAFNNNVKKRQVKPIPELDLLINALVKAKLNASKKYFSSDLASHENHLKIPAHDGKVDWSLAMTKATESEVNDNKRRYRLVAIRASHGTGKTSVFLKEIFSKIDRGDNVCFIAHRAKLVSQACSILDIYEYKDKAIQPYIGALPSIGVCFHSLKRKDFSSQLSSSKYVAIDEASQLLTALNSDKNIHKEAKENFINDSKKVIGNKGQIYLLDADLTSKDIKKYQQLLGISDSEILVIDVETPPRNFIAYINVKESYQSQRTSIIKQIESDYALGIKSAIACESEKSAEAIYKLLSKKIPEANVLLLTAKTVSKLERDSKKRGESGFIENISEKVKSYDCVIYTNVIGTGVSIEHESPIFTKCYGIFSGNVLIQNDWLQMMRRFRTVKEFYFEITDRPSYRRLSSFYKNTIKEAIQDDIKDDLMKIIEMDIQHETEQKRDLGVIGLLHHLKEHGFTIKGDFEELADELPIKEITEEEYENVLSARIITGNEAGELKRNRSEGLSIEDHYALKRYEASEFFGGEITHDHVKAFLSPQAKKRLDFFLLLTRKENHAELGKGLCVLEKSGILKLFDNITKNQVTLSKKDIIDLHDAIKGQLPLLMAYGYLPEKFNDDIKKKETKDMTKFIKKTLKEFGFEFEKSKQVRNGKEVERPTVIKAPAILHKKLGINQATYEINPETKAKADLREEALRLKGQGLGYKRIAKELNITHSKARTLTKIK